MAGEIMAAKLCEIDGQLVKLYRQIRHMDTLTDDRLLQEMQSLQNEVEDGCHWMLTSLEQSKAAMTPVLWEKFQILTEAMADICEEVERMFANENPAMEQADGKVLFAEYNIDFAVLMAKHALWKTMEAEWAQRQSEKEELL